MKGATLGERDESDEMRENMRRVNPVDDLVH